ncbi:Lrp/AsnC family transcriptional regulator [Nitrincola alkalilacustris]|uniref:Lrp/AsnC family transcriptional regulator n=1 Tax=Nitrincola alkalilacustris TaxID=1571224 RepID=UPI00124EE2CD|nr:Lrp/AsnC family transcriptional regulator [Nitrincola alkalilacustris]
MDKTDRRILSLLQVDGRLSNVELADQVSLSPSPCLRRVKRLEESGVITGYHVALDRTRIGLPMTVFVEIRLENHRDEASQIFEQTIMDMPNVLSCHVISGAADYLLEVVVESLLSYEIWLKTVQKLPVVKDINSNFAIRTVKTATALPLD